VDALDQGPLKDGPLPAEQRDDHDGGDEAVRQQRPLQRHDPLLSDL